MLQAAYCRYFLTFHAPATTSRTTMRVKETYFVKLWDSASPERSAVGECALFRGLGADDVPGYEDVLRHCCKYVSLINVEDIPYSSIRFGFESALASLKGESTPWTRGEQTIDINGLIWMGSLEEMTSRVAEKIAAGFKCLKLKIGGIEFSREVEMLRAIRSEFGPDDLELRLDANGSFTPDNALERLDTLSQFQIHSIEQPIKAHQLEAMGRVVKASPIPVALDEELIGVRDQKAKQKVLSRVKPQYIIIKPSLCGGFDQADKWIAMASGMGIGWWATSALESDVGLYAIGRWVSKYLESGSEIKPVTPQGLGTGQLYRNNIPSPLVLHSSHLGCDNAKQWDFSQLDWITP